jgi:hypothetical protein
METQDTIDSDEDSTKPEELEGVGTHNLQDFHAQLGVILEPFIDLQDRGFIWDQMYKGRLYPDITYQLFVPFIKCDTVEAENLCGKSGNRVLAKQLCRYCHVPTKEADDHLAKHKMKTVTEVRKLVEKGDLVGLRRISQTYLKNSFYDVRFNLGNDRGIHGACPMEMPHAVLLGMLKYLRAIFLRKVGEKSKAGKDINALAKLYCKLFARQSDRSIPPTAFSKGLRTTKLMAKEYRGILLIMLAVLHSSKGRRVLKFAYASKFKEDHVLDDWILLLETVLQWEAYLCEPEMEVKHLKRLEKKHRYIMYCMQKVAQRTKGMGLKLMKFHGILHMVEDILLYGVPMEVDTGANESHHKPAKAASKHTQQSALTFNFQTATRLFEFQLIDLAMEEINNGGKVWEYYNEMDEGSWWQRRGLVERKPNRTDSIGRQPASTTPTRSYAMQDPVTHAQASTIYACQPSTPTVHVEPGTKPTEELKDSSPPAIERPLQEGC